MLVLVAFLFQGWNPHLSGGQFLLLATATFVSDLSAARWPEHQRCRMAPVFGMMLLFNSPPEPTPVLLVSLFSVPGIVLGTRRIDWKELAPAFLAPLPLAASAATVSVLHGLELGLPVPLLVFDAYLVWYLILRVDNRILGHEDLSAALALPGASLLMAYLAEQGVFHLFLCLPLLMALVLTAEDARMLFRSRHKRYKEAEEEAAMAQKEIGFKAEQVKLLRSLSRQLARNPDRDLTLEISKKAAKDISLADGVDFLTFGDGGLRAPAGGRFKLDQLNRTYESGKPAFHDEGSLLAVPIQEHGLLVLNSPGKVPRSNLRLLSILSDQARVSLQCANRFHFLSMALEREAGLRNRLETLLKAAERMSFALEPSELLAGLRDSTNSVCRYKQYALFLDGKLMDGSASLESKARRALKEGRSIAKNTSMVAVVREPRGGFYALCLRGVEESSSLPDLLVLLEALLRIFVTGWKSASLHQEVLDTYAELKTSQAQLVQSSRLAAVGQLAAGVAHELNTPLGAIRVLVEHAGMLLKRNPDAVEEKLTKAVRAVEQAELIVKKVLFYSREARQEERTFDLLETLHDALEMVDFKLRKADISVDLECHLDSAMVTGKQSEIHQVFTNLLVNAHDSLLDRESGRGIRVSVSCAQEKVVVEVSDNGPPIPPEIQSRLFEAFFTTKDPDRGTGLGLSISSEIIAGHRGSLIFVPEKTFRVMLPAEFTR